MQKQILKLRAQGKTYSEIVAIVGCSKGTVSYYCGKGVKEKILARTAKYKQSTKAKIASKVDTFLKADLLMYGLGTHKKRGKLHKEIVKKIMDHPYCYLTGDKIDFSNTSTYSLDHIIPFSVSEDGSLENMGLSTRNANQAKAALSVKEFIKLCKKVVKQQKIIATN